MRRLNTISGGQSAATSSTIATKVLERRTTVPDHTNSAENSDGSWTGRRDDPSCPVVEPKRRRPVSASSLHHSSERSPTRSGGDKRSGFGTNEMVEELYVRPFGAETIELRRPETHPRPYSAKGALQRPDADRQICDSRRGRQRNGLCKIRALLHMSDSQRVKPSSTNYIDGQRVTRDDTEDNEEREPINVIPQDPRITRHLLVRETSKGRESTGMFRRKSGCEHLPTNQHTLSPAGHEEVEEERGANEEDRVWLLDR